MVTEFIVTVVVMTVLILAGIGVRWYVLKTKKDVKDTIRGVVDEVNKANKYVYEYEKSQIDNIKNLDKNVTVISDTVSKLSDNVKTIEKGYVTRGDLDNVLNGPFTQLSIGDIRVTQQVPKEPNPTSQDITEKMPTLQVKHKDDGEMGVVLPHATVAKDLNVNGTSYINGELIIRNGIRKSSTSSGTLVEATNNVNGQRYGVSHTSDGHTRLYGPNMVSLSRANGTGYEDIVQARSDKVILQKPLCLNDTICLVASTTSQGGILACPASDPRPSNASCRTLI